ncbi:MAG: recombinase XerD [Burkholderiaceae bacterium]|jgi:site-specific recombinase XerD|uniref:Recombinase XerD n=1 Tax=Cupriavidus metallidurans TaxID=119219 RepID=A0A482IZB1_9BURK|nr:MULTISPECIES: phage integrase family protein [Cupriavidus]KWR71503.1 recombinase XerD [Cupriavidus sp. SHE]PCH57397.1 MAG: recombinase XerD [Burkholderiaceae bacterium]QBP13761.1 recombinase XerD [Cupriavidus metallidurans]QWC91535.1 recombinase XerD [Cupriavidus metallidurans]
MPDDRDTLAATKLTRTEFAVVRAYAQGMKPLEIANRYLQDPDDDDDLTEHQAIQRILALRDRLVQFALQHDRPDIAEMFEALRGRSDAGMTRRVDALTSIEQLGQGRPLPGHQVSLWFGPSLSRRLMAAGIRTIADMTDLANRKGSGWWRHVPRIGRHSAEIIVRWLGTQSAQTALKVSPHVLVSAQLVDRKALYAQALGRGMAFPVPLELMRAPETFAPWAMALGEELKDVQGWVAARASSPNTWKSYRREAERFLLWAAGQGKSLRAMAAEDLDAYRAFLGNPEPSSFWCGPAGPRDKAHWRPFEGPLRTSSCEAAMRVISALLRALRKGDSASLARSGVVEDGIATVQASSKPAALPRETIESFLAWLGASPSSPRQRAALAAALLLARHGIRIVELASFRLVHFSCSPSAAPPTGRLLLEAKSTARRGEIVLEEDAWSALSAHWTDRQLAWDTLSEGWDPDAALLAPIEYPSTARGRAKQSIATAGYSASGLEQLLRASWRRFAETHDVDVEAFTPRQLRLG